MFYDDLFRSIRDSILIADTDSIIIDSNPAFTDLFGYTNEEIRGMKIFHIYKDMDEFREMGKKIKDNIDDPTKLHTVQYKKKTGEIFSGETNVFYFRDPKGEIKGFIGLIRDIGDRLIAEEELYRSKEHLSTTLNSIGDGVITTDLDGNVTSLNSVACDLTGWSVDEALNQSITTVFNVVNAKNGRKVVNPVRKVFQTGACIGLANHTKLISRDGREYQIADSGSPISDRNGNITGVVLVFRDVTRQYMIQEKLELNEKKYRELVESVKAVVWEYSISEDRWVYVAPQSTSLLGWHPDEWTNLDFWITNLHLDDRENASGQFLSFNDKMESHEIEYRFGKKDGSFVWIRDVVSVELKNGKPATLRGLMFDITDRKNAELALSEKTQFIQTVMDNLPIGVALNKTDDGSAIYMNRRFEEIYGWDGDEIKGVNDFFEKVYPDEVYREKIMSAIIEDLSSGDASRMHWENNTITRKDGSNAIVNAVNIPLPEQNIMVSTVMDVTSERKLYDQVVKARDKAEESDRLKSAFLANLSHEIRTPMNGILGFTDLLRSPGLTGTEQGQFIDIIQESGNRMLSTLTDLVDMSKIETGQLEISVSEVNINDQLTYYHELFRAQADKKGLNLVLESALPPETAVIKTDKTKLDSILSNLIKNALKFTDYGRIGFGCRIKGDFIEFFISDTGIGIPENMQKEIFKRFVQVENELSKNYEGSGIGLSIVEAYVHLLGGKVWLESYSGTGSTFRFTLPRFNRKPDTQTPVPGTEEIISDSFDRKLNIVIAEDDEVSSRFLEITLRDIAGKIVFARNGIEAVELCKLNPDSDLVLMDMRMPELNGYEATQKIREFNKKIVIIAQTALALDTDRLKVMEAGCNSYISKPVSKEELLKLIKDTFLLRN